jgi:predicted dehydrogenase
MTTAPCRWGILGAAQIARKNWQAIQDAGNAVVTAVASRQPGQAAKFIADCQGERPFANLPRATSYEELVTAKDVDAIYLPIPTGLRIAWGLKGVLNGKHLLCEKPCAKSAAELRGVTDICQSRGLQFMDGVMFMHTDRIQRMQTLVQSGRIGKLRRVDSHFCFSGGPEFHHGNIRMDPNLEPFGCLGDLGWYNIRLSLAMNNFELPQAVVGRTLSSGQGATAEGKVPTEFSGELLFSKGYSAGFYCSFQTVMQQWGDISGDEGRIHIPDFVLPYEKRPATFSIHQDAFLVHGCEFKMAPDCVTESFDQPANNAVDSQESRMIREFSQNVIRGVPDDRWIHYALTTQHVLDCLLASSQRGGEQLAVPPLPAAAQAS